MQASPTVFREGGVGSACLFAVLFGLSTAGRRCQGSRGGRTLQKDYAGMLVIKLQTRRRFPGAFGGSKEMAILGAAFG